MNGNIVHCDPATKTLLTLETQMQDEHTGAKRTTGVFCDIDGEPIKQDVKYAGQHPDLVEVYLDTITGQHVAKVKASQLPQLKKDGVTVYQGVGLVGWFVDAPDYTVMGRHGGKATNKQKTEAAEPAPKALGQHFSARLENGPREPRKAKVKKEKSTKKAA